MNGQKLRVLDLFSGIGGFSLGLERAGGFETVAFCKIEPYCRKVLAKHWPSVKQYDDVRTLTADTLARDGIAVDVICGGFPCQDLSFAGKRAGLSGARSGLWGEYRRLIGELRPRFVIAENVPGILSLGLGDVLRDLAALGYDACWECIPASAVGAPHRRDRWWLVAYTDTSERREVSGSCERMAREKRLSQWQESSGRLASGGEVVANAAQERRGEAREYRERSTQRIASSGEVLANAKCGRLQGGNEQRARPPAIFATSLGRDSGGDEFWSPWRSEPDVGRVAYGLPAQVDRLRALGNSVVPQCVELIGKAIMQAEGL